MKVAVNLTWLDPGRVGGSEEYLTRQLLGVDPRAVEIELFCDAAFPEQHPQLAERFEVRTMPGLGTNRVARIMLEHTWLAARARGADVIHHGGGTVPLVGPRPVVLTIHDLQYRRFPAYFGRVRSRYLRAMMPRSARGAAVIAVPSEFVRADVIEAFDVHDERVLVVPHGVPHLVRPNDDVIRDTLTRHGLGDRPFVLYPAITHPHKGHRVLVEMLDHLDDDTALVLIGGVGSAEEGLAGLIASSPHGARVRRLGRVLAADRDVLLAAADVLVFPSEFEGFGAPVVEAMDLGTPVVCSSADALVEVVGDAAIVVAEPSGAAWANGVASARRERVGLVERGHRRRECFTMSASGNGILAAYRMAAGMGAS